MTGSVHVTDVAIIGAGPVGLFAVFECGMLKMRSTLIDTLDDVGGQCTALYPEKPIYDIPGFPAIDAGRLVEQLEAQAAPFKPAYFLGQQVETLTEIEGGWRLGTSKGNTIEAKAVIVAAGAGAFGPNRPPLAGIERFEGTDVLYAVKKREAFRDKRVVIAGGGDSAVDWAISLSEVAASVQVVHRRAKFRAAPESASRLQDLADAGKVELVVPYQLDGLEAGADGRLAAVTVRELNDTVRRLEADHLLAFFGLAMTLGPIADWGLGLERSHIAVTPATCATTVPGIFAIGDIATYPGKLKLILCGFSEAAMAAHAIHPLVFPGEALHFEYSTSKGVGAA